MLITLLTAKEAKANFKNPKVIIIPTDKYLEKCFLLFKRFLKENGSFFHVMAHIFPVKRTKEDFFKEVKRLYAFRGGVYYDFGCILHMRGTLGDRYRPDKDFKNSNRYWEIHIKPISEEWKAFFIAYQPEIEDGDFFIKS